MKSRQISNLEIIDIADKGRCVGKEGEVVVFTEGAVPGDVVDATVIKQYHSYIEAKVDAITTLSPFRTDPFCEHFGICGGCKWQNLQYDAQLRYKEKQVRDAMQRIAKLPDVTIRPIVGSPAIKSYHNKLDYSFTNKRYLLKAEMDTPGEKQMNGAGFHIPGKFNKILDIDQCWLQDTFTNSVRNLIRDTAIQNQITFYDVKKHTGVMRGLIVRNTLEGAWMAVVMFGENDPGAIKIIMEAVGTAFPQITSLLYVVNQKKNDTIHDQEIVVYRGQPHIVERMDDLEFLIGPKSFFQTNSVQAKKLYEITRSYADLKGDEIVYDLYTGTGTIAAFVAQKAKKVIGIEYVPEAIADAKVNAARNNITNMEFFAGDMKDVLTPDFTAAHGTPNVIITDPSRAGMHEKVTARLLEMQPDKIVYVSCNPGTQARDLLLLSEKYEVVEMQPVDMFPHTSHVENVALLKQKTK